MGKNVLVLKWQMYVGWTDFKEGILDKETDSHFHIAGLFCGTWYQKYEKSRAMGYKYEIINK